MIERALHSTRVLLGKELVDATISIGEGKILRIESGLHAPEGAEIMDCGDDVIMPGLIDAHVHINEPGRTEWEGFDTATRAAARGGITTLVDMPLNSSPVSVSRETFTHKLNATNNKLHVNCGFWGGLIPGNTGQLESLIESGVFGIKAFLTHSGIDEFPNVTEQDIREALPILKKYDVPLLVHCELDDVHTGLDELARNPTSYQAYLQSRPRRWEDEAIALMIRLCEQSGVRIHIVHLSSSDSLGPLREARVRGVPLTVETCPHYLVFSAEDIPDGHTEFKCAPPIRERSNNDHLWRALRNREIDFVVTDHSPAPSELKELESGNFERAWGGIAGLQYSLPAFWTSAEPRGFDIADVGELMSTRISKFLGLDKSKGLISEGYDADLVVWSPERSFGVRESDTLHKHKLSPYTGMNLRGMVRHTFVGGAHVFNNGSFRETSRGQILIKQ